MYIKLHAFYPPIPQTTRAIRSVSAKTQAFNQI